MTEEIVYEGDTCPECGDGVIEAKFYPKFHLECSNCDAEWDDKGMRVKEAHNADLSSYKQRNKH